MNNTNIRGVIFDYGGTLDTRGDHWSEVIWDGYCQCSITVDKQAYRDAYVYGERALAVTPIVTPEFHFIDILREKLKLQLQFLCGRQLMPTGKDDNERQAQLTTRLDMSDEKIELTAQNIANSINNATNKLLCENRQVLERLRQAGLPMVLVSNFYGNIKTVLRDAHLDGYFKDIVESAVVGVRKPNPAIFALGVCALDLPASEVLVVGDTYSKDIVPAHKLGCHTIWIKGKQWEEKTTDESICDAVITQLDQMLKYV